MRSIKALVLGCGNIGAGYDFHNATITQTHARAFSKVEGIKLYVADENQLLAMQTAINFNAEVFDTRQQDYSSFDIISLATPTPSHFQYLNMFLKKNIPVIVCEKPVADSLDDLQSIEELYKKSTSKILVNYIRRFQPAFQNLKKYLISNDLKNELNDITLRYHRGLLNNATHGIDLLEFLLDTSFSFKNFQIKTSTFDAFSHDPSISGTGFLLDRPINFVSFPDTSPSIFEVEIKLKKEIISIADRGDTIRFANDTEKNAAGILTHYMEPVINRALNLFTHSEEDNFMSSCALNKKTLAFIKKIQYE